MPAHLRSDGPHPASTVVVLRDCASGPEAFMVRRHEGSVFMGGAHVFPGGRVDDGDRSVDQSWCDGIEHAAGQLRDVDRDDALAYHVAAARELFEEAGILVARDERGRTVSLTGAAHDRFKGYRDDVHGGRATLRTILEFEDLRLALDALIYFSHWVTPPVDTRQFDTRFFLTRAPSDQTPAHDETETTHSTWLRPSDALAQMVADEIVLPPPTWTTLRELESFGDVESALAWARTREVVRRMPQPVVIDGRRLLLLPGDPLYRHSEPPLADRSAEASRSIITGHSQPPATSHQPQVPSPQPPVETRFVLVDRKWRAERPPT